MKTNNITTINCSTSKIRSIKVEYVDGHTEQFSDSLIDRLSIYLGQRQLLSDLIEEFIRSWDKESALTLERKKFSEKETSLIQQAKKEKDHAVKSSSATLKGQVSEKWFPFMKNYPYNNGDVIHCNDPFDYIVLVGLHELNITQIVFQEVKTGVSARGLSNPNERELGRFIHGLNNDKIKFEHWARVKDDEPFKQVLHPAIYDETSEPEYLKTHKYCPLCKGYFDPVGHRHFHPFPNV